MRLHSVHLSLFSVKMPVDEAESSSSTSMMSLTIFTGGLGGVNAWLKERDG